MPLIAAEVVMPRIAAVSALTLVALAACSVAPAQRARTSPAPVTEARKADVDRAAPAPGESVLDRMLVRAADMGVEVEKPDATSERVVALAPALGGYVESSGAGRDPIGRDDRRVVLRIPSTVLDAAMDSVARLGHVVSRSRSAEDVTDEVVDLDARVTSLRASRDRLRQLLDRATSVSEVLTVERELARAQAELDSLEARLTQARGEVTLARLTVSLKRKHVLGPLGLALQGIGWVAAKLFIIR
ncbi:MAG: DUF4349 domain-containing protein [Gemmatimonadaceae bacterium]|nr:DUF4349 domain-containing protein [Gemmatimonadaceae bacterium]NUR21190.1 DUF4349 domain-containing protein [Gemmatimonadaceae bacterium]